MIHNKPSTISKETLYVVPTPIGNLGDITYRAIDVLKNVDLIAAEDTRRTKLLLSHFSISARLFSLHNHNEKKKSEQLLQKLRTGQSIALVSDAGTPLISDPGYYLVHLCRSIGIRIVPLPGACAVITALCASGISSDRFCYEGFLPEKSKGRKDSLISIAEEPRTLIFYESTHRLIKSLKDMITVLGPQRYVILARELTKVWESIHGAPIETLLSWVQKDDTRRWGEIVLIVEGYKENKSVLPINSLRTLRLLKKELPLKTAVAMTAEIHNLKKNALYRYALGKA